ncbi:MAG: hypothetical protein HC904_08820 [Blastochloris sp.]|nr:hypothetical protein [Blastochloris sp.]
MAIKPSPTDYWQKQARCWQRRWNTGLWLDAWLNILWVVAALGCPLVLVLRREEIPPEQVLAGIPCLFLLTCLGAWIRARSRFITLDQGRVSLEESLKLNNRLTAAFQGVGIFPPVPAEAPLRPALNWKKLLPAPSAALFLFTLAWFIPLDFGAGEAEQVYSKPPALEKVESWVRELKKQNLVEPESLRQLEKEAAELAGREGKEWYRHGTLEAMDRMEERTRAALQAMEQNLGVAQQAVREMSEAGMHGENALTAGQSKLSLALRGLEQRPLPLDGALAGKLRELGENGLRQLSQKQLDQLLKELKEGQGACQGLPGRWRFGASFRATGRGAGPAGQRRGDAGSGNGADPVDARGEQNGQQRRPRGWRQRI